MSTFFATVALSYQHLDRATAGLLAELRRQLLAAEVHEMPQWETFEVTGPRKFTDLRGRTWYGYRATVESQRPIDCTATATSPGQIATEFG